MVDDGLGELVLPLSRYKMPLTVKSLPAVTPPVPVILKLFTLELKTEAGKVSAEVLVNTSVAEALLASMLPELRVKLLPERVRVFDPTVSVPAVSARVPATLTLPVSVRPLERFSVRLFNATAGRLVPAPEPAMTMFELLPPVKLPEVYEIAPSSVRVFAPMENAPLVSVRLPVTSRLPDKVTPFALLIIRLGIVEEANAEAVSVCRAEELNSTVPLEAVNVPEFEIDPEICRVPPLTVSWPPVAMVTFWQEPVVDARSG